jgi:small-conductance mechanosensitive channel/CRP-like cAMP-binding protein
MDKTHIQFLKPFLRPTITFLILLAIAMVLQLSAFVQHRLTPDQIILMQQIVGTAIWLTLAWFVILVLDIFLWRGFIEKKIANKVPRLLKTALNVIVLIIIFILIISYVFHRSITGLIATTGVIGIILGFGFRGTIENAVSGITLSVDPVFQIGDIVYFGRGFDSPSKVVEMTWRYTVFEDNTNNLLIVPNSVIFTSIMKNYSRPSHNSGFSLFISVSIPNTSIERVRKILEAALKSTPMIADDPSPIILISDIAEGLIKYQLKYWIAFKKVTQEEDAKHELYTNILHHFKIAGIDLQVTNNSFETFNLQSPAMMAERILQETDLFSELSKEEIIALARGLQTLPIKAGHVLIRQNEAGDSMYILAEGLLKVDIEDLEHKQTLTVAKILPGDFFGEMSLLVGDPRSATISAITDSVVYEISKAMMQRLFEFHPNLVQLLSQKVAERHMINLQKKKELLEKDLEVQTRNYANMLLTMIKKWFRITGE